MKTIRKPLATMLAAAALAAALTACGGGAGSGSSSSSGPPTVAQVAAQVGATGLHDSGPAGELYAYDAGTATWHGRTVTIYTFKTTELRDNWLKVASQFTGIEQQGPLWVIADS